MGKSSRKAGLALANAGSEEPGIPKGSNWNQFPDTRFLPWGSLGAKGFAGMRLTIPLTAASASTPTANTDELHSIYQQRTKRHNMGSIKEVAQRSWPQSENRVPRTEQPSSSGPWRNG